MLVEITKNITNTDLRFAMAFNPLLQLNVRYVFGRFGMFELLQFDASDFSTDTSIDYIVSTMKDLRFYESSQAFLKFNNSSDSDPQAGKDEFGNYMVSKITGEDYVPVLIHELIGRLKFTDEELEYYISMQEVHHLMSHNIKRHTGEFEVFYELKIHPDKKEKIATTCYWDNFRNFVGVDKKRKIIHLISIGVD